jgi:EAL domain-containing protein (putative c-di-GMP-specific phosphodiesterase class I)
VGHAGLIEAMHSLRALSRNQPITLEIHEKAVTDCQVINELRGALQDLDIKLAFDDFGAGQARLADLSVVKPDYLKFDMSLLRDLHQASPEHRQMIATLVRMARDLGIVTLAEGIESSAECNACVQCGFELSQGFYFGRPVAFRADRVGAMQ